MKPLLKEKISSYAAQLSQSNNKLGYQASAPALLIGLLIFLNWFSISIGGHWHIAFSWIALGLMWAYYYQLDVKLAVTLALFMSVLNLLCLWVAYPAPSAFSGFLFLGFSCAGLILQFWGRPHAIKDYKAIPQILDSLLIAPVVLLLTLIKILKLEQKFDIQDL